MNKLEKYFLSKTEKLSYIELKNKKRDYQKIGISDIPLPVVVDDLLAGISNSSFNQEISLEYIVKGIYFNIAIDPDFKYVIDYIKILRHLIKDPVKQAISYGISFLESDMEQAIIYFRAGFIIDEKDEFAAFNYARLLWRLDLSSDDRPEFVESSIRILERIIRYNDKNSLAYYELGNINKALGEWIKANSFYGRALESSKNPELDDDIRSNMIEIAPDVAVEDAIYFINRMDYRKAIETLLEAKKNSNRYDIPYYLAIAYLNQEKPEIAELYFEEAIEKGADFSTLYVDYTYIKYVLGKDIEALNIANRALEKYPSDIKLRYNRAIIFISLKRLTKAEEDLNFILEYQDLSDELFNQIMILKEQIRDLKE